MSKTVAVIDGNSLMHRAFHAVPPTMNAPDGTPTNAVFGFMQMLLHFIDAVHPDAIVCAFDAGKCLWRMEAIEQYKAQRPPMDPALRPQFPIIEEVLASMDIPVVKAPGWEGDDILGTIAARNEALGQETLLITGDKDAYQLTSELTRVVTTKKGLTDVAVYGPAEVAERYGVTPAQFPDYLGLMGDSSDNIPGVPGIGPKNASALLNAYGSMEGIYENIDKLKGKQKINIEENRDLAFASKMVATIARDVEFELDLESVAFPAFSTETVKDTFGKYRLASALSRVLKLCNASDGACSGEDARALASAMDVSWLPLLEGNNGKALIDKAIADGQRLGVFSIQSAAATLFDPGITIFFNAAEGTAVLDGDDALEALALVIRKGQAIALDAKELVHLVFPVDSAEPALLDEPAVLDMNVFDAGLAAYVLDSSLSDYPCEQLAQSYLGYTCAESDDPKQSAAEKAAVLRLLAEPLVRALEEDGSSQPFFDIDLPLIGVLARMERIGAAIDTKRMAALSAQAAADQENLRSQIYAFAGEEFNVDSTQQLSHILFEVLGLKPLKKNKRGYSTDAGVLTELAKEHPLPELVLRYREIAKIKSTYLDALPAIRRADGLVHTSFNEKVTTTGRLSSSEPNLQNIPVRTDFGRSIRECFVPLKPGEVFLSADYSQIELRLLAHLSGDEGLIAAFNSGADFHASTAAQVFGMPIDQVTSQMRSRAKAVNFGIVYGQQAFGLAQNLDIPIAEAKEIIDRYFETYPQVKEYLKSTVDSARENGFAQTMTGRKRRIPELSSSNYTQRSFGERTAMNHPMQGSAADIIKLAMVRVMRRMDEQGLKAHLMLQVHDELDFSVPEEEIDALTQLVKEEMENVMELSVPLLVDVNHGPTWADAH